MKHSIIVAALAGVLSLNGGALMAAPGDGSSQIYGSQLMTQQEISDHRAKLRAAKTQAERNQIRQENHERMQQRARERGVQMPDMPPQNRGHMNQGQGMGNGMGQGMGNGMGQGNGQGMGSGKNQ
ncbi:hypothetical protein P8629_05170 [Hydrogenovibrio sp. 3SP14C1]|uniref:hypothetical protein n=1 Tax=Hydrogenovibrio sp. 3SP14C1 TaxID=3038774 RepID=UPI002415E5E3|nr:hypothetical protein [Hydrogenovibrio sp. 3SP14C1]MDG4812390.1 hypothetical protein [Hydrogenovibrio sp. 3SP14C1]